MLEIPDTQHDWRFKNIPGVSRYYAGQPLSLPLQDDGPLVPFGSLCVLGDQPRDPMTPDERGALADLANLLSTDIQREWQEIRQRKETSMRNFISDLIANLSSLHSNISPPVSGPRTGSPKPAPESEFHMLSATSQVRSMLESDFACLVDLSSLHLTWAVENMSTVQMPLNRKISRSSYGWIGHGKRGTSFPSGLNGVDQESVAPLRLRIIDYSCSDSCREHSPEAVFNTPRAMNALVTFLRTYTESSKSGFVYTGSDGALQYLLPPDSESHIAIPLFNNSQPALLLLVSTQKPFHVYEPADVSFASTFAVLCLGSLIKIKLIKADAAKTAFVSMISHELRTPLHGLLSQLELIREFAPKEFISETETFLQTAEVCGFTLRDVLNDVLDFGKQEHANLETQTEYRTRADIGVLAIEALHVAYGRRRQWQSATGESQSLVEVHVSIEESLSGWSALIDVGGLRRVLLNLASNALKYTPKGSIVLSVRELETPKTDQTPDGRRLIEFSMQDTGIGISNEYKEDIFTPFSQESKFNPGSGLGMSISEAILQRMGGAIEVSSELRKGTTVTFTLLVNFLEPRPVRMAAESRTFNNTLISQGDDIMLSDKIASIPIPPDTPTPPAIDSKIPLSPQSESDGTGTLMQESVSPTAIGRKILTTLLARRGVPFREASDGLEALSVYREFRPHLVWTDVSMPVMDGIESARQMRMIEKELQLHAAWIVAITGLSSPGEMKEGLLGEAALDEWLV
ncbi:hypothetical protein B0H10DRAFT_2077658 [Mycena sp. CBHHK59/15]|nr:hypothetical protein B0H10DRAFT_2077658 [Mycena sp. CBHHK59/15]